MIKILGRLMKKFNKILATRQLVSVVAIGLALNVNGMSAVTATFLTPPEVKADGGGGNEAILKTNIGTISWNNPTAASNDPIFILADDFPFTTTYQARVLTSLGTVVLDLDVANSTVLPHLELTIDAGKTFGLINATNSNDMLQSITLNGILRTANNLPLASLLLGQPGTWEIISNNPTAEKLPATTDIGVGATLSKSGIDVAPTSITGPGTLDITSGTTLATSLPAAVTGSGTLTLQGNATVTSLPATININAPVLLSKSGIDFAPTSITGAGNLTITGGVTATTSLPTGTTTIDPNATLFHAPAAPQVIDLAGTGLYWLVSGSAILSGTPNLSVGGGPTPANLTIAGNYNGGAPVNVTINRGGTVNVGNGVAATTLTANTLTFSIGDGDLGPSANPVTTGLMNIPNNGTLTLTNPAIIVIPDLTVDPGELTAKLIQKLQPNGLVSTLITKTGGAPTGLILDASAINALTAGVVSLGIRTNANDLELFVVENTTNNLTIDTGNLQDFGTGQFSTGADSTTNTIASFHIKAAQFVRGVRNLVNAFSKKPIEIQKPTSTEPLVMESFDKQSALFLSTYYGDAKTNHSRLTAASLEHQTGVLVGMMKRLPDQYIAAYLGISAAHARARFGDRLTQFTKGMELGGFYSREFLTDAEWNNSVTILLGWGEKRRTAAGGGNVFISKPKTQKGLLSTELGYKFKLDKGADGKTYFSLKPYGGLKFERLETLTHSEKSATGPGITFKENHFGILNSYIGLGVRKRINIDDFSVKITGLVDFYQNIKRPNRMQSHIFLANSSTPLTLESNPYAKNKLMGSLVGSVKHKESLWKGFMTGSIFRSGKKSGKQISVMLNRAF